MKISEVVAHLEGIAPPSLQEHYDNAGLLTGNPDWECTGIIVSLDSTSEVIAEAIGKKCNLVVAHHPIIFKGLKRITGSDYVGQTVIKAIKNDIAIYAIHTNLDNLLHGVNKMMADKLGLVNRKPLQLAKGQLKKLHVFVPASHEDKLKDALFVAGAGSIGNYSECSFSSYGKGSFKGGLNTSPYVGTPGERHYENECRIEVVFPYYLEGVVLAAMKAVHPYEEIAFDLLTLDNSFASVGAGLVGELPDSVSESEFLAILKDAFSLQVIKHTAPTGRPIKTVALCGGAGSFLISNALTSKADVYITADLKYHEFFEAEGRMLMCDIGHFESEQFTIDLLSDIVSEKFPNFAVLKTRVKTNPVHYFS